MEKERKKLEALPWPDGKGHGVWDYSKVRHKHQVAAEARRSGRSVHFGRICPLCYLKNAELSPEEHIYKGRAVFLGDNVRDQDWNLAFFPGSEQFTRSG